MVLGEKMSQQFASAFGLGMEVPAEATIEWSFIKMLIETPFYCKVKTLAHIFIYYARQRRTCVVILLKVVSTAGLCKQDENPFPGRPH